MEIKLQRMLKMVNNSLDKYVQKNVETMSAMELLRIGAVITAIDKLLPSLERTYDELHEDEGVDATVLGANEYGGTDD